MQGVIWGHNKRIAYTYTSHEPSIEMKTKSDQKIMTCLKKQLDCLVNDGDRLYGTDFVLSKVQLQDMTSETT